MKTLGNKLKNLGMGLGIAGLSLLPMKSLGQDVQEQDVKKDRGYAKIAFSMSTMHELEDIINISPGILFGYGKEIINEVNANIDFSYYWGKNKDLDLKMHTFEIGPNVQWHPTIGDSKPIYFGAGAKYKSITLKDTEYNEEETLDGIGFSINFGFDIKVGNGYIFFEGEYDRTKTSDDLNLGATKISAGLKF